MALEDDGVYRHYKPLRNFLRTCDLDRSLQDLWTLSKYLFDPKARMIGLADRPAGIDLKPYIQPWDLLTYAKEVILHARPGAAHRLNSNKSLEVLGNSVKRLEDHCAQQRITPANVLAEVYRSSHRQFPLQTQDDGRVLLRYLKLFGSATFESMLREATGLSLREFYFLGMALGGSLLRRFDINAYQDYREFGIDPARAAAFFKRLSRPVAELREMIQEVQTYDPDWAYAWNPLEAYPLVALDPANPNRLYCPVPTLLLKRVSSGLYYDLVKSKGFSNPFGEAFERYVGEVLQWVYGDSPFLVRAESPYWVGRQRHDGPDWILSDDSACLFIECKTKRIRQDAKFSLAGPGLEEDLGKLADAIVQTYKNIAEAQAGLAPWNPEHRSCFPLVVTLEEWYLIGPYALDLLRRAVVQGWATAGLDQSLPDRQPYFIASSRELEMLTPVIREVGIGSFFHQKAQAEYAGWMLDAYAGECFPQAPRGSIGQMFGKEWKSVLPSELFPDT